eukprot:2178825-Amphidinium_carterae.1
MPSYMTSDALAKIQKVMHKAQTASMTNGEQYNSPHMLKIMHSQCKIETCLSEKSHRKDSV